jgi:phosphoribosylanthranilate isomerase
MLDYAPKVKICGVTTLDDALACCDAGADAIGFNFAPEAKKRERYLDPDDALAIIERLPSFVTSVAVCVNERLPRITDFLTFVDRVQLHGEEDPTLCTTLGYRAIKAFRVAPDFRVETMLEYRVGGYLLDAWTPDARGGTGKTFDWDFARRAVALNRPIILAGGLTPANVAEAVRQVRPYAVDTAGGVESAPGKKDHAAIKDFVRNAKRGVSVS